MTEEPTPQTDEPTPETEEPDATATADGTGTPAAAGGDRDVRAYLLKGALAILTLFAVFAAFRFYTSASTAIDVWVADQYRSLFQAAFNLVVLLLAGVGISLVVRHLTE